jgi:hypothetical protein
MVDPTVLNPFRFTSLRGQAINFAINLNEIISLRKKQGSGRITLLHPSPIPLFVGATPLSDNRHRLEMNRDAMLSSNFHLPILSAMLLLIPV